MLPFPNSKNDSKRPPHKRVLIAEDEELIGKALAKKFMLAGFDVSRARDGKEALDKLTDEAFDLIVLDLMMPVLDGFDVLGELKRRGNKTPVMVATNLDQAADVSRAVEMGCNIYYVKAETSLDKIVGEARRLTGMEAEGHRAGDNGHSA